MSESVNIAGCWREADGTLSTNIGLVIRKAEPGAKWQLEIVGVGDRVVGRMWENGQYAESGRGPRFTGSFGESRVALWANKSDNERAPAYRMSVERPNLEKRKPAAAPVQADDIPF